jgi:uncharacterized protein (TIGR02611 family)
VRRGGAALKRVALEGLGWVLVVAGIAALILPGPGLLMLFGGLAILSQQYEWAERRMRPVELRAKKAAAEGVQTVPRIVMSTLFALGLVALGVLWVVDPAAPSWWPVRESWWLIGGWATGSTLLASGVIALALIVWSIKQFRGVDDPQAKAERSGRP